MATDEVKVKITADASQATSTFSKFGSQIITLNQAFELAKKVVGPVIDAFKQMVEKSLDAQRMMTQVKVNVENAGYSFDKLRPKLESYSNLMVQMGFDDEATAESVSKLMLVTNDYEQALNLNQLAMDLARSKNIDLATATSLVTQVTQGNNRVLKQYGIELDDDATAADNLSKMQDKVKGSAEEFANSVPGKLERVNQEWENMQEQVGDALLPILEELLNTAIANLPAVIENIKGIVDAFIKVTDAIGGAYNALVAFDRAAGAAVGMKNQGLLSSFIGQMKESASIGWNFAGATIKKAGENLGTSIFEWSKLGNVDLVGTQQSISKVGKVATKSAEKVKQSAEKNKVSFAGIGLGAKGVADKMAEAAKSTTDAWRKVKDELQKINNDIADIVKKTNELQLDYDTKLKETKTAYAEAFIKQEEKIADLKKQMLNETDAKQRFDLQQQLVREENALNQRRSMTQMFQDELTAARQLHAQTEFEQELAQLDQQAKRYQTEYEMKLAQLNAELAAKQNQAEQLKKIEEELSKKAQEESKKRKKSITEDIDDLISKYNELANAAIRAYTYVSSPSNAKTGLLYTPVPTKKFAEGGIVPGPIGIPMPAIVHGGETVIPAGKSGLGSITINVTGNSFLDESAAEKMANKIMDVLKMNIRI